MIFILDVSSELSDHESEIVRLNNFARRNNVRPPSIAHPHDDTDDSADERRSLRLSPEPGISHFERLEKIHILRAYPHLVRFVTSITLYVVNLIFRIIRRP